MKIFVLLGLLALLLAGCAGGYAEIGGSAADVDADIAEEYIIIEPIFEYEPSQLEDGYSEMLATIIFSNQSEGFYLLVQAYYATLAEIGGNELVFSHIMNRGLYMVSLENMPNAQEFLEHIFDRGYSAPFFPPGISMAYGTPLLRIIYDGAVYDEMPHIMAIDVEIIGDSRGRLLHSSTFESDNFRFEYDAFLTRPGGPHEFRDVLWAFNQFVDEYFYVWGQVYVEEWGSYIIYIAERNYPHFWAGMARWTTYIDVFVADSIPNAIDYLIPYIEYLLEISNLPLTLDFFNFVPVEFTLDQLYARLDELVTLGMPSDLISPGLPFVATHLNRIFVPVLVQGGEVTNIPSDLLELLKNDPMAYFLDFD